MFNDRFYSHQWQKIIICLIYAVAMTIILINKSAAGETGVSLKSKELQAMRDMAPKIRQIEKGLSNLKIEVESWVEKKQNLADPNEIWERTPIYWHCTAWVDCSDWKKWRIDVNDKIQRWTEGSADYYEEKYSVSSDGNEGRYIYKEEGPIGTLRPSKSAVRRPDYPGMLDLEKNAIGCWFSMHFFENKGQHLSNIFEKSNDPCVMNWIDFTMKQYSGRNCIELYKHKGKKEFYLIDPERGFSVVKSEEFAGDGKGGLRLIRSSEVTKLKEITKGIWWPVEMTRVNCPTQLRPFYTRDVYRVINVLANDAKLDSKIFKVDFPKGYRVDDKIAGKTYVVDANNK